MIILQLFLRTKMSTIFEKKIVVDRKLDLQPDWTNLSTFCDPNPEDHQESYVTILKPSNL